jgi:hypothetical protein
MRQVAKDRDELFHLQGTARYLGDCFAWFFYQFETELIERHNQRPVVARMSAGVGGYGEYELARNLSSVDKHLVIHHSLTSFLRLGDLSIWNSHTQRIVGIGEAKCGPVVDGKVSIHVDFIFRADAKLTKDFWHPAKGSADSHHRVELPGRHESRRQRQLRDIKEVIGKVSRESRGDPDLSHEVETHVAELGSAIEDCPVDECRFISAGPGLLLIICRPGPWQHGEFRLNAETERELPREAIKLLLPNSPWNSLTMGTLGYTKNGMPNHFLGLRPLLWDGLSERPVEDLVFHRVVAITLFNPAHMLEALRATGLEPEFVASPWNFKLVRHAGKHTLSLFNLDYFFRLRTVGLYRHKSVLELVQRSIDATEEAAAGKSAKVSFQIGHSLVRPANASKR